MTAIITSKQIQPQNTKHALLEIYESN